jgi:hypothetical protein
MTSTEILIILAPTLRTVEHLEKLYTAAQERGEDVRRELNWLATWRAIRADGKSVIDGVTKEQWEEIGNRYPVAI